MSALFAGLAHTCSTCVDPVCFFNDPATTEIYTLSLHDALPISGASSHWRQRRRPGAVHTWRWTRTSAGQPGKTASGVSVGRDRKSTRLNSSHITISYAVFCLKKKKNVHVHMGVQRTAVDGSLGL